MYYIKTVQTDRNERMIKHWNEPTFGYEIKKWLKRTYVVDIKTGTRLVYKILHSFRIKWNEMWDAIRKFQNCFFSYRDSFLMRQSRHNVSVRYTCITSEFVVETNFRSRVFLFSPSSSPSPYDHTALCIGTPKTRNNNNNNNNTVVYVITTYVIDCL